MPNAGSAVEEEATSQSSISGVELEGEGGATLDALERREDSLFADGGRASACLTHDGI